MYSYLNGKLMRCEEAGISIHDRGFRYGDGVFETIAACDGAPYQWKAHIERLQHGLDGRDLANEVRSWIARDIAAHATPL